MRSSLNPQRSQLAAELENAAELKCAVQLKYAVQPDSTGGAKR
jgi:hypothetical protein